MQTTNARNLYHIHCKAIIAALFFLVPFMSHSQFNIKKHDERNQSRKYSYGIHLGMARHNFRVDHSTVFTNGTTNVLAIEGSNDTGIEVGLIGSLHPGEHFEIRTMPGITFGNRSVQYYFPNDSTLLEDLESTMFDFPLHLKYKSKPYNDLRMYVVGGGRFRTNMSLEAPSDDAASEPLRLTESDLMVEIGAGVELHFPLFTLSPELKISQGILNQRVQNDANPLVSTMNGLYSRVYTLSFNIE